MDSNALTLASGTLAVLIACSLLLTPVGSAAGAGTQAASAVVPTSVLSQTGAGNTPAQTSTPAPTPTPTPTPTATPAPTPEPTPTTTPAPTPEPTPPTTSEPTDRSAGDGPLVPEPSGGGSNDDSGSDADSASDSGGSDDSASSDDAGVESRAAEQSTPTPTATRTPSPTVTNTPSPTATSTPTTAGTSQSQGAIGPPTVRVANDSLAPGDRVVITATFTNDGMTEREVNAVFRVFEETVEQEEIEIPAGESATVRFDERFDEAGRYRFSVNGQSVTADVVRPSPTPIGDRNSGLGAGPELVMVSIVFLAGGTVLLIRQL